MTQPYVRVGPYGDCDYVTDGVADQVQINAALADHKYVALIPDADYHINGPIDYGANSNRVLDGFGAFMAGSFGAR